jgi:hypothetical protein
MTEREPDAPAPPRGKRTLKERLSDHFNEYGRIAIITYFTLSILTIVGFSIAIGIGTSPESTTGVLGVIAAGWVAAKATLPIRILITLGVTPVVAVVVTRLRRTRPADPAPGEPAPAEPAPGEIAPAAAPPSDAEPR